LSDPPLSEALQLLLRELTSRFPSEVVDRVWIFAPREIAGRESGLVVLSLTARPDGECDRVGRHDRRCGGKHGGSHGGRHERSHGGQNNRRCGGKNGGSHGGRHERSHGRQNNRRCGKHDRVGKHERRRAGQYE
jgi:hypothetical protein